MNKNTIIRWVKATERLPVDTKPKAARQKDEYMSLRVIEGEMVRVAGCTVHSLAILEEWFPGVEWLEEIDVPSETPSLPLESTSEPYWRCREPWPRCKTQCQECAISKPSKDKALPVEPEAALCWIKASERAPQKDGLYYIKRGAERNCCFVIAGDPDGVLEPGTQWLEEKPKALPVEEVSEVDPSIIDEWFPAWATKNKLLGLPIEGPYIRDLLRDFQADYAWGWIQHLNKQTQELSSLREQLAFERQLVQRQEATIAELTKALK